MSGAHAGELQDDLSAPEAAEVYEAPSVLRLLWADPQYMPEHLALWSLKHFGPRASSAVEKLRDSRPGAGLPLVAIDRGPVTVSYCLRYRPAARQPEAVDTSTSHIGFAA